MRRALAVGLVVCGLGAMSWQWLSDPVSSLRTEQAQSKLLRQVPDAGSGAAPRAGDSGAARAASAADAGRTDARGNHSRESGARAADSGAALAVMRIPRFGPEWRWAVSEGVSQRVLADGPGHYPGSPLPGERGNSAYAAHRAGHGDPFIDFDRLLPGDLVHLSQGDTTWTYRLDRRPRIVPTSASWVLDPLPGRRLTLTTCWPKYGSAKRMYVTGHLVGTTV